MGGRRHTLLWEQRPEIAKDELISLNISVHTFVTLLPLCFINTFLSNRSHLEGNNTIT